MTLPMRVSGFPVQVAGFEVGEGETLVTVTWRETGDGWALKVPGLGCSFYKFVQAASIDECSQALTLAGEIASLLRKRANLIADKAAVDDQIIAVGEHRPKCGCVECEPF